MLERLHVPLSIGVISLVVVCGVLAVRMESKLSGPGPPTAEKWAMQDFRTVVYYPVVAVREGTNPYNHERYADTYPLGDVGSLAYSPLVILLHAPFALMRYEVAQWVYFAFAILLTLGAAVLILHIVGVGADIGLVCLLAAAMIASRPGHTALLNGQTAMQAVLGSFVALQYATSKPTLAGLGLALATIKPTFAVPLAVLMIVRRNYRAVAVGTAVGTLAAVLGFCVIAVTSGGFGLLISDLRANVQNVASIPDAAAMTSWIRVDLASLLARLFRWVPGALGTTAVALAALAVAGLALSRLWVRGQSDGADGLAGLVAYACVLVSVYHQPPDVLLMALPAFSLLTGRHVHWRELGTPFRWTALALIAVPALNYLATWTFLGRLAPGSAGWTAISSINGFALATVFALSVYGALRLQARRGEPLRVTSV